MERTRLPSTIGLRPELKQKMAPGDHEASAIHFGCDGCPAAVRFVSRLMSRERLIELMDQETDVPRAFVYDRLESMGQATPCETDEETREPVCLHEQVLQGIPSRLHADS
jgi:hypothetical protein